MSNTFKAGDKVEIKNGDGWRLVRYVEPAELGGHFVKHIYYESKWFVRDEEIHAYTPVQEHRERKFSAGDKVKLASSVRTEDGVFVKYNDDGATARCTVEGYEYTYELGDIKHPYPEYAADVATYRDAVATGKVQGELGQDIALLRLIGHLLGEGGGK